jgi:cytochrome P450
MAEGRIPPGPKGSWLLGSLSEFRRDMLGFFTRLAREYGDCASYRLGNRHLCLVSHPDLIEHILTHGSKSFSKRTYVLQLLEPIVGNGLLTSEGDFWLRQRRLAQPAFSRQRIAEYGPIMVAVSQRYVDRLQPGESRDLHADMMRLALEIVTKALFDADVTSDAGEVGAALEVVMENFIRRWESLWQLPEWWPTPSNIRRRRAVRRLDAIVYRFIHERRQSGAAGNDLLSRLLQARDVAGDGTGMTDLQLRDELMTLFLAGHETTANAMAWTWYLLGQNPEKEAKLADELERVLAGRPPTVEDIARLPYTEAVVQESLRLYPPAYGFGRIASEDCQVGEFLIKKGTTAIMSQWVTHRDPRFFDEPDAFRPERWLDGLAKRLHRYAYFPFGGGARQCIGNTFAMMEAVLILATIVPRYRFVLVPGHAVVPRPVVTLRPEHGIKAVVEARR